MAVYTSFRRAWWMLLAHLASRHLLYVFVLALVPLLSVATATTVPVPSGEYDLTIQTGLPHLEEALRYATTRTRECLHESDATRLFPLLLHRALTGCVLVPDAEDQGMRFKLQCENPEAATGSAVFDVSAGHFSAVLELKMGGKNMTVWQRVSGGRIGSCSSPGEQRLQPGN
jgi:hypothetical protein